MTPLRVIKVGGSLFDFPHLHEAIHVWLQDHPAMITLLIAGGGQLAEEIRRIDTQSQLGEQQAHWLCIDALGITAKILAHTLGLRAPISLADVAALTINEATVPSVHVLDVKTFLKRQEADLPGEALPHNWDVTSDSIAARVADVLNADELVLFKSAGRPESSLKQATTSLLVDPHFEVAVAGLQQIRIINLRDTFSPAQKNRPMKFTGR